jgi:hypothetical protein
MKESKKEFIKRNIKSYGREDFISLLNENIQNLAEDGMANENKFQIKWFCDMLIQIEKDEL